MKKIFFICIFCLVNAMMYGQTYTEDNSLIRKALVQYIMDDNGFYHKQENVNLTSVTGITDNYAYNKNSHELYVMSDNANIVITVADNYAKFLKKNKSIPQMKETEISAAIHHVNTLLDEKFSRLNEARKKQIADSVKKAREDSVVRAREDSIRLDKLAKTKENYIKNHNWPWVPVNKTSFKCSLCDENITYKDSLFCIGFRNDTLFHVTFEDVALDETHMEVHTLPVPLSLKDNGAFKYHIEVYGDSLLKNRHMMNDPQKFNLYDGVNVLEKIRKKAPYGFFDGWDWGSEFGVVSFNFKYTNTNKNTIKYITVYWKITNGVKDVRKTGFFKGTGPVEEWESGSWNWDYSSYFVAGDASYMDITKVIITYMNGSQKVLTGSMIKYN